MQDSIGPNDFSSARRGITRPVVEQLALVRMKPFFERWVMEGLLLSDHGEMGGVDEGNDEWDVEIASIVFGV